MKRLWLIILVLAFVSCSKKETEKTSVIGNDTEVEQSIIEMPEIIPVSVDNFYSSQIEQKDEYEYEVDSELYVKKNNDALKDVSNVSLNDISLNIHEVFRSGLYYSITNNSDNEYLHYYHFELYVNINNVWEKVKTIPQKELRGMIFENNKIMPHSTTDILPVSWVRLHGELPDGKYKVEKEIIFPPPYDNAVFYSLRPPPSEFDYYAALSVGRSFTIKKK
jgi:hypothetical protein